MASLRLTPLSIGLHIVTELSDSRYQSIDTWDSQTALHAMWESQMAAVACVGPVVPVLAQVVDAAVPRLRAGGRLVYAGAGTSIRIAVQDGTELGPTFGWPDARCVYLIAGGPKALMQAVEGAEDDTDAARTQVNEARIGPQDVVLALAASGRTPFTIAAIQAARDCGALTVGMACNPDTDLLTAAEYAILTQTGPEVIAGSTRMKAGTVQKVLLNMLSTQIMIGLGHVHDGLMVDMRAQNAKLRQRAIQMVARIALVPDAQAEQALLQTDWQIKPAVLVALGLSETAAQRALADSGGLLRAAMARV